MSNLLAAAAPAVTTVTSFSSLIDKVVDVLGKIVPLLIGLAVVVFLYGVLKFITAAGDETKRKEGKDVIIYGIIGLFVMVSVWGLVNLILGTFTLSPAMPTMPGLK